MNAYFSITPLLSQSPLCFNPEWIESLFTGSRMVWVGFSGGVDSHVLLHALVKELTIEQKKKLVVIHVHHGLSLNADDWLLHCEAICRQLEVRFVARKVVLESQASIEDAARKARYQAFEKELNHGDVFLMAHHAGDQAETVLFRLLRGTGGKGLSGIPVQRDLGEAQLLRPLLETPKASITDYAKTYDLSWIEDESNNDERFTRNFIRHRILPTLKTRFPQVERHLVSTAQRVATDYTMLADFAAQQLVDWCNPDGGLELTYLVDLSVDKRLFWLRHFLQEKDISLSYAQLSSLASMLFSDVGKQPEFCFSSGRIMRHQNAMYVLPKERSPILTKLIPGQWLERDFDRVLVKGDGRFSLRKRPQNISLLMPNDHSRKLKKWFNDQQVPIWWRDHLPYLYLDDELIAIGSLWRHPSYVEIRFDWHLRHVLAFPFV